MQWVDAGEWRSRVDCFNFDNLKLPDTTPDTFQRQLCQFVKQLYHFKDHRAVFNDHRAVFNDYKTMFNEYEAMQGNYRAVIKIAQLSEAVTSFA
jgi:hypothetical protein